MLEQLSKIEESLSRIDKTLERNTVSLEYHIKITDMLESKVEHVDTHVKMVNGVFKFLLGVAALSALLKLFL